MHDSSIVSPHAKIGNNVQIGRFCIIDEGVELSDDVSVGDFSMISSGSRVGTKTNIGTYTKIGKKVRIGKACSFTSFCEIRDDCILGDYVSMGSRCTLSAGTRVEDHVIIKYSFVYTDTPILTKNNEKNVGCLKKGSRYGANVTIMPGITVGENSEIGACSLVRYDVPDNEIWYGTPATFYKKVNVQP